MYEVQIYNNGWITDQRVADYEWVKEYLIDLFNNIPTSFRVLRGTEKILLLRHSGKGGINNIG